MKIYFFLIFGLLSISLLGQESVEVFKVYGVVKDSDRHMPLQFVTVSLQDMTTMEVIGDVTDKEGQFELTVPEGKYYCVVESLSFQPFIIHVLTVNQEMDMGVIELEQSIEKLDEIEIVAKNKLVDHQLTKKVYNASKDIANVGGNAVTVLENTPTVRIDDHGNISIRGNNAMVLVDGKPYGGQRSNADVLSLIPANTINKVEIISQSAKYDAEGGGAILNIVLKKRGVEGYNGTVEARVGIPDNAGLSSFVNFKTDKVNIFSTASFNHQLRIKDTRIEQTFLDNTFDPIGNFEETRTDYRQRNSFLINIGSDFYLDDRNTLTTSLMYTSSNKNYDSELFLNDYQPVDELIKSSDRLVNDNTDESYLEAFIQYTTKFNQEGHELSFDFRYDNNLADNKTDIENLETYPGSDTYQQYYIKNEEADNYYFKLDYVLPLKNAKLELGHKSNFRKYQNDFFSNNLNPSAQTTSAVPDFSSIIAYDETIYAFYVNYSREFERLGISLGLRSEQTKTTIEEKLIPEEHDNNYTDLFPKALITYAIKDENMFSLGFMRYIDRPTIAQLNPFNSFTDERFVLVGNPYLNPYYTNYFYFEYYHEFEKLSLNSALFYSKSTDRILNVLEKTGGQTSDGFDIYKRTPVNNGTLNYTGLEVEVNYNPNNKIRLYALVSPYFTDLTDTEDQLYDNENLVWYANGRFLYKITNTFRFNIDYIYQSEQETAITQLKAFQYVNLNISKDFFDGQSTLSLKINDLFHTRKSDFYSAEANTLSHRSFIFDTQYLLSFSYRFNKSSKRNTHNRSKDIDKNIFEVDDEVK